MPSANLQSLVLPTISLIQGAIFRRKYNREETKRSSHFSLNIRPLSELMDMYHARDATDRRDKVYALLGMSTDSPPELSPDYEKSWKDVFQMLIKFSLSDQISVKTQEGSEMALIEAQGRYLGRVSDSAQTPTADGRQSVEITWEDSLSQLGLQTDGLSRLTLQALVRPIQRHDVICLLEGASQPTIIRAESGGLTIVMISVPVCQAEDLAKWSASTPTFEGDDLLLVWDWDASRGNAEGNSQRNHQEKPQVGKDYASFIRSQAATTCPRQDCQCQNIHDACQQWSLGLWLSRSEKTDEAEEAFRKAAEFYEPVAELKHVQASGAMDDSCIENSRQRFTRLLLRKDANCYDLTALGWAAKEGYEAIARLVLDQGVDLEARQQWCDWELPYPGCHTPLSWAATKGHKSIVQLLLDKGAYIEAEDESGHTPLWQAIDYGHEAVVQLLIDRGADWKVHIGPMTQTPLSRAAERGHEAIVRLLLNNGEDLHMRDPYSGRTPFAWAVKGGHEAVMRLLLEKGANLDTSDQSGITPLSLAAEQGHEAVVRLLLDKGADLEASDQSGGTPLTYAARRGHEAVVRLLLDKGADLEAKDHFGQTVLWWAADCGHEAVVQLLLNRGADLEATDEKRSQTPLARAANYNREAVVRILIDRGAKLEVRDKKHGRTPLGLAVKHASEEVVQLLLDKGANPNAKDMYGRSPLRTATEIGRPEIVRLLKPVTDE